MQSPRDDRPVPLSSADDCADAETLAALMDGTLSLDQVDERELERLVRRLGPEALLWSIADAPRLSPRAAPKQTPDAAVQPQLLAGRLPLAAAAILALAVAAAAAYLSTRSVNRDGVSAPSPAVAEQPAPPLRLTAAPIVLTAARRDAAPAAAPQFRAPAPESRAPRLSGTIASVDDGEVRVDLGALDGLEKGTALDVFRQPGDAAPVGTLTVTRVFREYATGVATPAEAVRVGDAARVDAARHVAALLARTQGLEERGHLDAAQEEVQGAIAVAQAGGLPAEWTWRVYVQAGTLEQRAGNLEAAERSFRAASAVADSLPADMQPDAGEVLNELGALLIARQAYTDAERVLTQARRNASEATAVRAANNLAAVTALRGDLAGAESLYRAALDLAKATSGADSERQAIETNLQTIGAVP